MPDALSCPRCGGILLQDTVTGEYCCAGCGSTFRIGQTPQPDPAPAVAPIVAGPAQDASKIDPLEELSTAASSSGRVGKYRPVKHKRSATPVVVGTIFIVLAIVGAVALILHGANEIQDAKEAVTKKNPTVAHVDPTTQQLFDLTAAGIPPGQPEAAATEPSTGVAADLPPQPNPRKVLEGNSPPPAIALPPAAMWQREQSTPRTGVTPSLTVDATLDDRIGSSMQLAVNMLLAQFQGDALPDSMEPNATRRAGLNALCVYALLQAGQSLDDPRLSISGPLMPKLLDALRKQNLSKTLPTLGEPVTYARSLRAAALAVYNRPTDHSTLQQDVVWLIKAHKDGGYSYDDRHAKYMLELSPDSWDNSNSQYGLLGVWAGAEVGVEAPDTYWQSVAMHWRRSQQQDGQWIYADYKPYKSLAMTCGGIASMLVTYDYLDIPKMRGEVARDPFPGAIGSGLAWLENGDNSVTMPAENTFYLGYDLYSLERVGLASGLKYFGTHDWYRELAIKTLRSQFPNGAYAADKLDANALISTSYGLLFLSRGRAPLLMNKLRFDAFWANRPRDLANLTRFASHELERKRLLNWQVVSADRPWRDWFDCPVLYIASHKPPALTEAAYANLRGFVEAGGLIFTQADAGSKDFNDWVPLLARKVSPDYELADLSPTHPLFSSYTKSRTPLPKLRAVSNGSRLLIVHCPVDVANTWQRRDDKMHPEAFNLGMNVAFYANGKTEFRNRVATTDLSPPESPASRVVKIARLKYAGNWNAEPFALERFGNFLSRTHSVGIEPVVVAIQDLKVGAAPIALLTGTDTYHLTKDEAASLQQYVNAGGCLIVDPTGGRPEFVAAMKADFAASVFPGKTPMPLPASHPFLKDVNLRLRPYAIDTIGKPAALETISDGTGTVIISPLDLSTGLLNANTWGINGYTPESCQKLMTNIIDGVGR